MASSLEVKSATSSILLLCITAYFTFDILWGWLFVLLIVLPVLSSRFPAIGYLFGASLLLTPFVIMRFDTSVYLLLFSIGVAIYGGFLIKSTHAQITHRQDSASSTPQNATRIAEQTDQTPLFDQIKQRQQEPLQTPFRKSLFESLVRALDGITLVAVGLVSIPTFLALCYFGLKWPIILGLITFAVYLWRVTRYPDTLAIKNPWDLRWHGLVLCMCCLLWVLLINLVPQHTLLSFNSTLPAILASSAWFEYGSLLSTYLNQIITMLTTGIFLAMLSILPTALCLLLLGWLFIRAYLGLSGDIQQRFDIMRWPFAASILILIMIWPNLETAHAYLFDWMLNYEIQLTYLVELFIIGFLPWRVWTIIFKSQRQMLEFQRT